MTPAEHEHGDWDQGGYCNRLVLDDDGYGTVCGYRPAPVVPNSPSLRDRLILALAQADGQEWASIAEASRHTADYMYGKQADAVLAVVGQSMTAEPVAVVEHIHEDNRPVITARVYSPESWKHLGLGTHLHAAVRPTSNGDTSWPPISASATSSSVPAATATAATSATAPEPSPAPSTTSPATTVAEPLTYTDTDVLVGIAGVVEEHAINGRRTWQWVYCACGWVSKEETTANGYREHREHVADAVVERLRRRAL